MITEIWKDINGFEGLYKVSNLGRVKRMPYEAKSKKEGTIRTLKYSERVMAASVCANGYKRVTLRKDCKPYFKHIHRLVAETFLPNPNNYKCVNHKDEVKTNNQADNLEWCSYSYNNTYGSARQKFSESYSRNHMTPVAMFSTSGNKIKEFPSFKCAAQYVGGRALSIYRAAKKDRKTAYGYIWNLI